MTNTKHNLPIIAALDVETTGTEENEDSLLQIALIMVNTELDMLDEQGYESPISYSAEEVAEMKAKTIPYVLNMHNQTNLWERVISEGKPMEQVDEEVFNYINSFAEEGQDVWVLGNSITLDRNFIRKNLPKTFSRLHHRSVDVTSIAGPIIWWNDYSFEKQNTHEALTDIKESINEFRDLRKFFKTTL